MSKVLDAYYYLLRAGMWGIPSGIPMFCSLSAEEWSSILALSKKQTVRGLVFSGVEQLPQENMPSVETIASLAAWTDSIERRNIEMDRALSGLWSLLQSEGLHPVLAKGQAVASFYRQPLYRECGDIDLYFRDSKEMEKAVRLVSARGAVVRTAPDGSRCFRWKGIVVEYHPQLIDLYSPAVKRYISRTILDKGFVEQEISGGNLSVMVPAPELNLLMLYAHVLKHAIGKGIGMRQMCDAAMACSHYAGKIDSEEFRRMCVRSGMSRWCRVLHSFMTGYLGLPEAELPFRTPAADASGLAAIVMKGGNFGQFSSTSFKTGDHVFMRKVRTALSFLRHSRFSLSVAPGETFGVFLSLLAGQARSAD